ncbi:MAG TPA: hypothetical protein VGD81_01640 [Opitutaceae bacterium]
MSTSTLSKNLRRSPSLDAVASGDSHRAPTAPDIEWTPADSAAADKEGWNLFNVETSPEIQRDDEADLFPTDDAAVEFVRSSRTAHGVKALALVEVAASAALSPSERFDALLNNIGSATGNDDEIAALRTVVDELLRAIPAEIETDFLEEALAKLRATEIKAAAWKIRCEE